MAEAAAVIIEQGTYRLYIRGAAHLVLSPEGDSHRLIRLAIEPGGGLAGTIVAVTGRPAPLLQRLPPAQSGEAEPLLAGEYRLRRCGLGTDLAFEPSEHYHARGIRDHLRPFAGDTLWRVAIRHPRVSSGGCALLPPHLARRLQGRTMVPADPPHFLDYAGVQLLLTPAGAHAVPRVYAAVAAEARR